MAERGYQCSTADCRTISPRPFCQSCWRRVPKEQRAAVRQELERSERPDADPDALRFAIASAAASIQTPRLFRPDALKWELIYIAAGAPKF